MDLEILRNIPFFAELPKKRLRQIAKDCEKLDFQKDECIIRQDVPGMGLYLLLSGSVKVYSVSKRGESKDLAVLRPPQFFGEMALIDGGLRSATVVALEDVECAVLSRWKFMSVLRKSPEVVLNILPVLVKRIRDLEKKLMDN